MLTVQSIANKERGVVATQSIAPDMLLEVAPVASFPAQERATIDSTQVAKYYFVLPDAYQHSKNVEGHFVFGLASFCNHDDNPNAKVAWIENEVGLWAHLISLREIKAGEEVTLYYTNVDEYAFS